MLKEPKRIIAEEPIAQEYSVFGSRLKIAKDFKHWVTSEVLPSIRKNGAYIRNQENMTPAEIVARGLIAAQKIIEERDKG